MKPCIFCRASIDPGHEDTWRLVEGWVGGPKRNGFTLQSKPHAYACNSCIRKQQAGHAPDEQEMNFDE